MRVKDVLKYLEESHNQSMESIQIFTYECDHEQIWQNSNKLLHKSNSYIGIKTGNTPNAKFCLASKKNIKKSSLTTSKP